MFKYRALFGWGITMYAVMFLMWSGFIKYGFVDGYAPKIISYIILVIMATIAGRSLHLLSWTDILPYSFSWAVIIAILDAVYAATYVGWAMYSNPSVIIGYLITIIVPLFMYDRIAVVSDMT